jgi:hypothetical protein
MCTVACSEFKIKVFIPERINILGSLLQVANQKAETKFDILPDDV